jgi:hypothetical protein
MGPRRALADPNGKTHDGADIGLSRNGTAREAGLSNHQRKTALRVCADGGDRSRASPRPALTQARWGTGRAETAPRTLARFHDRGTRK